MNPPPPMFLLEMKPECFFSEILKQGISLGAIINAAMPSVKRGVAKCPPPHSGSANCR